MSLWRFVSFSPLSKPPVTIRLRRRCLEEYRKYKKPSNGCCPQQPIYSTPARLRLGDGPSKELLLELPAFGLAQGQAQALAQMQVPVQTQAMVQEPGPAEDRHRDQEPPPYTGE